MYVIGLSQAERGELTAMLSKGKRAARKLKRAQILLAADAGCSDDEIARTVAVGGSTVYRTKRRFVEGNLERALSEDPRPGAERKLTGKEEALLVATACANPPEGRARWTLELLADAMVQLTGHESLSGETVRRRLAARFPYPLRFDAMTQDHAQFIGYEEERERAVRRELSFYTTDSGVRVYLGELFGHSSGALLFDDVGRAFAVVVKHGVPDLN